MPGLSVLLDRVNIPDWKCKSALQIHRNEKLKLLCLIYSLI